jgi:hypothetical protein
VVVLRRRCKTAAKYRECVRAGERSLTMLVVLELESIAEGFGEGVRTVILKFVFVAKDVLFKLGRENFSKFLVSRSLFPQNNM